MAAQRHAVEMGDVQHLHRGEETMSPPFSSVRAAFGDAFAWRVVSSAGRLIVGLLAFLPAWSGLGADAASAGVNTSTNTNALNAFVVDGEGIRFGLVRVDPATRRVSFPARVNMTNGIIEYLVVTDYGKSHESLFTTEAGPVDVQSALLLLNAKPAGTNSLAGATQILPARSAVNIHVTWRSNDREERAAVQELVRLIADPDGETTRAFPAGPWLFNGSYFSAEGFAAHFEGSIISLIRDPVAVVNNPHPDRDDDEIHVPASSRVPPLGTEVSIIMEIADTKSASPE
jgi:hypothetical protein